MFTTKYDTIKKTIPFSIRKITRDLVLNGLSLETKMQSSAIHFQKPRIQFLYIHHVFDDELGHFETLIKTLFIHHSFISYSQAVTRILTNSIDKPYICISSDDGFKNNLNAASVLDKYGIKGCFFLNPDSINLKDPAKTSAFCKTQLHFPPTKFMDWNDVDSLMKNGHEIGSHTMGHINIAETDLDLVEDNLNESFEIIAAQCGKVDHFAFPFGRFSHFNLKSLEMVYKAGYKSCATAERGCHVSDRTIQPKDLFIRRDHVICDWNLNHILYFILNNSKKSNPKNNFNPY